MLMLELYLIIKRCIDLCVASVGFRLVPLPTPIVRIQIFRHERHVDKLLFKKLSSRAFAKSYRLDHEESRYLG
jgi:hypothetical protein